MSTPIHYYCSNMMLSIQHHRKLTPLIFTTTMFLHFLLVTGQYLIPNFRPNVDPLYMGLAMSVTIVVVVVIFVVLHFYCKPLVRPRVRVDDGLGWAHPACIGLDLSVIETFPIYKYSEVSGHRADSGPLECSVCLGPFEAEEMLRLLPKCNHIFHVSCLDPWLKDHATCPLCRVYLVPEPGELTLVDTGRVVESVSREGGDVNENVVLEVRPERAIEEGQFGKYRRWNSTGHMAVDVWVEMKSWGRFTLKLPEDMTTGKLRRCSSL